MISAAILALVRWRVSITFAGSVVATLTDAVAVKNRFCRQKNVLTNLRNLTEEVRTLGDTLREIRLEENPIALSRMERLREALTAL